MVRSMDQVKRYGLSRRRYVSIKDYGESKSDEKKREEQVENRYRRHICKIAYGGNQEWFPKDKSDKNNYLMSQYGCGVIAITDLFLYWAMTLPNGKETFAGQYLDERNQITKENYMLLVEEIRKHYVVILGSSGTFAPQLTLAINHYAKDNHIEHKAIWDMSLNGVEMMKQIEKMLQANQPVILMIGHSLPLILSRFRKKGIPFYKQTRILNPLGRKSHTPYACYQVIKKNIFGHFVVITGMIIDKQAERATQHIMLRISSWGTEYYISYHHLRQYMTQISRPYLSGIISLGNKK
ncbi:MAG: hypothetical protein J6F30_16595 [Cellulosilyticum sp.]|nr:hypothetical protein [Cellulosilyticum sp.]